MQSTSDHILCDACLRGDDRAWAQLVDRYSRLVYSIARSYRMDDASCDDVVQCVFLAVFRQLESLRDRERLSAWLITITHRECWRIGRQSNDTVQFQEQFDSVNDPSPDDAERWERQWMVSEGMNQLGGRCQELLTALFLADGPPNYEGIAEALGMKVGSIGPTRARCFEKLERILIRLGFDENMDSDAENVGRTGKET